MSFSDLQIKTRVRSILSKHWIDAQKLKFDCCTGTLRFRGELRLVNGSVDTHAEVALLEILEREIKSIPGVRKVYFMGVKMNMYGS